MNVFGFARPTRLLVLLMTVITTFGCSPKYYRMQADRQADDLVQRASLEPDSPLQEFTIDVDPGSRMFDPFSPDFEPMPPDDPTSHQLMHCVDHKKGYPCWDRNGYTEYTENPYWAEQLGVNEENAIPVNLREAVRLSLVHSGEYQTQLEGLYLSALDVSFERFRFDAQFFGGYETFFTADGPDRAGGPASVLDLSTRSIRMSKLYASGGELVVGLANRLVWQFAGDDTHGATTLLDFSIVQPLLRARGRVRVLERLTLAERALLADVRQMERFRRGFYAQVASGIDATSGSVRVGGFLGLLQDTQEIRNQEASLTGLRSSLDQLEASYTAGRIDRFQVDLARQALYESQSRLLSRKTSYQTSLDSYKIELGLPPEAPIVIDDPLLDQFNLLDPDLLALQKDVSYLLDRLRGGEDDRGATWDELRGEAAALLDEAAEHVVVVRLDMQRLQAALPERRANLHELIESVQAAGSDVDPSAYDPADLDRRAVELTSEYQELVDRNQQVRADFEAIQNLDQKNQLIEWMVKLSRELQELMLLQAGARLDSVVLTPVDINSYQAYEIARCNRRDWKNARADLVDSWRQITFNAADLASNLNVVFEGDISNTGDNPIRLRGKTGRLRAGVEFDAPLTRLAERNNYRQAQIEYQQARRDYYAFEDRVSQVLRATVRNIDLNRLNFELRRAAVQIAISQVELAQLKLNEPPKVGQQQSFNSSTARDLVTALNSLLNSQNDFLSDWVNYEVLRLGLDFNLGTMEIDSEGMWLDPGAMTAESLPPCEECVPGAERAFSTEANAVGAPGIDLPPRAKYDEATQGEPDENEPGEEVPSVPFDDPPPLPEPTALWETVPQQSSD